MQVVSETIRFLGVDIGTMNFGGHDSSQSATLQWGAGAALWNGFKQMQQQLAERKGLIRGNAFERVRAVQVLLRNLWPLKL